MFISDITKQVGPQQTKAALDAFLSAYLAPAFGALPKQEVELLVLRLLMQINAVDHRPSVYELVSKLKINSAKARKLIYEQELRVRTNEELDADIRNLIRKPILLKRGQAYALEVENPLLADHLRAKLKKLGHLTDGSFSPSIITLSIDALVALINAQLTVLEQEEAKLALLKAGAPDTSFKGVLKSALGKLGNKIADESGQAVASEVAQYIGPILDGTKSAITKVFMPIFKESFKK